VKKISEDAAQPIFVENNTYIGNLRILRIKVAQNVGLLLY
jgi:hypothetical protein